MPTYQSWRTGMKPARKTFIEQMNHRKRKQGSNSASLDAVSLAYKTYTPVEAKKYITPTSYSRRLEYSHPSKEELDKYDYKQYIFQGGSYKCMDVSSGVAIYRPLKDTTAPLQDSQMQPAGTRFRRRPARLNYWMAAHQPTYNLPQ